MRFGRWLNADLSLPSLTSNIRIFWRRDSNWGLYMIDSGLQNHELSVANLQWRHLMLHPRNELGQHFVTLPWCLHFEVWQVYIHNYIYNKCNVIRFVNTNLHWFKFPSTFVVRYWISLFGDVVWMRHKCCCCCCCCWFSVRKIINKWERRWETQHLHVCQYVFYCFGGNLD